MYALTTLDPYSGGVSGAVSGAVSGGVSVAGAQPFKTNKELLKMHNPNNE